MYIGLLGMVVKNKYMFTESEQAFLEDFKRKIAKQEMAQVTDLIRNCDNKFQFAKTHSVYVKDWEKMKLEMESKIKAGQVLFSQPKHVEEEMINLGDLIVKKKLEMVQSAFTDKFGDSIFNYLGSDGKTRKLFGLF